jgi:hypothetical protein
MGVSPLKICVGRESTVKAFFGHESTAKPALATKAHEKHGRNQLVFNRRLNWQAGDMAWQDMVVFSRFRGQWPVTFSVPFVCFRG